MLREAKQWLTTGLLGLALGATLSGCGAAGLPGMTKPLPSDTVQLVKRGAGGTTRFLARNVIYRLDKNVTLFLEDFNGDIVLKDPALPFVPANKSDYAIAVHHAKVFKDAYSLESLLNTYVFNDSDSPLRNLHVKFQGNQLILSGQMKKVIWVSFEMVGTVAPTPDGKILMTPTSVKSEGLRVDGLLGLMGLQMQQLLQTKAAKGVIMQGNNILMDPSRLFPPPSMLGFVSAVSVANEKLVIEMSDGKAQPWPDLPVPGSKSCLVMWGGDIVIDSCLNLDAKMQILDTSPKDPLMFALDRYREQLEAGFVIPTRAGHMIAYVPNVTNFDTPMGRFAPPGYPIPGFNVLPSDLVQDHNGDGTADPAASQASPSAPGKPVSAQAVRRR